MVRLRQRLLVLLPIVGITGMTLISPPIASSSDDSAAKGAQVYCFMRSNGNGHQVSWEAAYALIKRQKSGMFKTSPEHAAVMITEAVVKDPGSYPDCGKFLGNLFGTGKGAASSSNINSTSSPASSEWSEDNRYSY